jgi:hypothetical protein
MMTNFAQIGISVQLSLVVSEVEKYRLNRTSSEFRGPRIQARRAGFEAISIRDARLVPHAWYAVGKWVSLPPGCG